MEPLTGLEKLYDEDYDLGDSDNDYLRGSDSDEEDEQAADFEREMQAELTRKMAHRWNHSTEDSSTSGVRQPERQNSQKNKEKSSESKKNEGEEDEDAPFYDASLDAEDNKWVDERRRHYLQAHLRKNQQHGAASSHSTLDEIPLRQSDAVLNCPACMTLLCRDCQRHQIFSYQYRAMFVENCRTDESTRLACPLKGQVRPSYGNSRKRRKGHDGGASKVVEQDDQGQEEFHPTEQATNDTPLSDLFHPVFCTKCNTQVAVMGAEDEVYHFYNIVTSQS